MAEDNHNLSYFLVGLGVGIAVGILMAPKSGEETRGYLKEKADEGSRYLKTRAEEGKDYVRRRGDELRESASDLLDKSKDAINRQKEQIASAVEAGRQAYRETMSDSSPLS
jgi:gas vesicle protein